MGHVRGGWSGHIRLAISGRSREQLHAVGLACIQAMYPRSDDARALPDEQRARGPDEQSAGGSDEQADGAPEAETLAEPHISLTRAFYLQQHQIAGFMQALEAGVCGLGELTVGFGGLSTFVNERGNRGFVAVDVAHGCDGVRRVLERVDRVMERFGKPRFFADARFHASVVRLRADKDASRMVQRAGERLGAQMDEEILRLPAARIDTLECVFGNRRYLITLNH
ncbi:poly(U)-specific 3'-to-5' RNA exonuclease [Coemansia erecta]|nr:poly(U)-specific 3'-to-5' RNA exonuclease [Coemansia erecta]